MGMTGFVHIHGRCAIAFASMNSIVFGPMNDYSGMCDECRALLEKADREALEVHTDAKLVHPNGHEKIVGINSKEGD